MISIAMLVWTYEINERQRTNFSLANALMDMQVHAAVGHLWFEEILYGDRREEIETVWENMDSSIELAEGILNGGESEHGVIEPIQNTALSLEAGKIKSLLIQFKGIALERYKQPENAGIGSPLDEEFDDVFIEFARKAAALEDHVERDHALSHARWKRLFFGTLLSWALVVVVATIGLWSRERRRKAAEDQLLLTNEQLQSQAEELSNHRLRLLELVDERTAELLAANKDLHEEIQERRRAVEALQVSRDKFEKLSLEFHVLLDSIPDGLTLLSPELKVMWANRGAASMFLVPISELTGQSCRGLWNHRSSPLDDFPTMRAFSSGKTENGQLLAPDGSTRDTRAVPIKNEHGQIDSVIEIAVDVTERIALQTEAQRMAHLASLGELAAGVAHEINNPINGIINYAQILADECSREGQENEIPHRIIREGNRIATIVRSLLSFAHETGAEKEPVYIHEVLSDILALCGRQLEKDGIMLKLNAPDELPAITANHQQIEQVFMNLVNNARYALNQKYPGSNKSKMLEISLEETDASGCRCIEITFQDQGTGIPACIMERVRDPFFSTKPKGVGTGLGLSISHGIIDDHGGRLLLDSVEGQYTKVQVLLPVSAGEWK